MARAQEQSGLLKPPHRTAQMRAIDSEYLKSISIYTPHPTGNVRRLAVPGPRVRIAIGRNARALVRKVFELAERDPVARIFLLRKTRKHESNQRHRQRDARDYI